MRLLKLVPEDTNIGFVSMRYWAFGITGLLTLLAFFRVRRLAGWFLVPYLCWVSFAALLNYAMLQRN